jgi:hypothetical protein
MGPWAKLPELLLECENAQKNGRFCGVDGFCFVGAKTW